MNNLMVLPLLVGTMVYIVKGLKLTISPIAYRIATVVVMTSILGIHFLAASRLGYGITYGSYMILSIILLLLALSDATTYELPSDLLMGGLTIGVLLVIAEGSPNWYVKLLVAGGVFLVVYLLGRLLRGGVGEGDAYVIAMVALYLGGLHMLVVVLLGLLLSSILGIGMMIFAGKSRKTVLPFVPFIAAAHIGVLFFW